MRRRIELPTPNLLGAYEQFAKETGKKEIRLGEFLSWLRDNTNYRGSTKMKVIKEPITIVSFQSEIYPEIFSYDARDREAVEWLDKNPIAFKIVTKTRSKAFGRKSCVYIGWAQNNNSVPAIIEKLRTLKGESEGTRFSPPGTIFQYRAQFTLKHYKDKGFTGGLFQQWGKEYPRDCLTLDYTPALLNEVIAEFERWISNSYATKKITINGKVVKEFKGG